MADPEIAKRNARRNYKATANEEYDAEDERKKHDQSLPYRGRGERNSQGDTMTDGFFRDMNTRSLKSQIDLNASKTRREDIDAGYYRQAPKFASGGVVLNNSSYSKKGKRK